MQIIILTQTNDMLFNPQVITTEVRNNGDSLVNGAFINGFETLGAYSCQGTMEEVMADFRIALKQAIVEKLPAFYFEMPKW